MPRLVDYRCVRPGCGHITRDVFYYRPEEIRELHQCEKCGFSGAVRIYRFPKINWGAYVQGVDAERDMAEATDYYEHRLYAEDQTFVGIDPNLKEV